MTEIEMKNKEKSGTEAFIKESLPLLTEDQKQRIADMIYGYRILGSVATPGPKSARTG